LNEVELILAYKPLETDLDLCHQLNSDHESSILITIGGFVTKTITYSRSAIGMSLMRGFVARELAGTRHRPQQEPSVDAQRQGAASA
jgi:hypothetical protein